MTIALLGLALAALAAVALVFLLAKPNASQRTRGRPALASGIPTLPRPGESDDDVTKVAPVGERLLKDLAEITRKIELKWLDTEPADPPTQKTALFLVSAAGHTDAGKRRRHNEDRHLVDDTAAVYAVADGMGGYARGDLASETTIKTLVEAFGKQTFPGKPKAEIPRRADELVRAINAANARVFDLAKSLHHAMGSTLVATRFALNKNQVYIAHVGDSRCYRYRDGELHQLTTDHTMAGAGAEGKVASLLSRAIGIDSHVVVDLAIETPQPDDVYLLCSDGLTKMVKDDAIESILAGTLGRFVGGSSDRLRAAVDALIDAALANGGRDNVTVVLVRVEKPR